MHMHIAPRADLQSGSWIFIGAFLRWAYAVTAPDSNADYYHLLSELRAQRVQQEIILSYSRRQIEVWQRLNHTFYKMLRSIASNHKDCFSDAQHGGEAPVALLQEEMTEIEMILFGEMMRVSIPEAFDFIRDVIISWAEQYDLRTLIIPDTSWSVDKQRGYIVYCLMEWFEH